MRRQKMLVPIGWISTESLWRLKERCGNDSRGTVPLHWARSKTSRHAVFIDELTPIPKDQPRAKK